MEDLCPVSHNLEVPFVKRTEYQVLNADADTGLSIRGHVCSERIARCPPYQER